MLRQLQNDYTGKCELLEEADGHRDQMEKLVQQLQQQLTEVRKRADEVGLHLCTAHVQMHLSGAG